VPSSSGYSKRACWHSDARSLRPVVAVGLTRARRGSITFYKALGAVPLDEWTVNRVWGAALTRLASTGPEALPGEPMAI
jgi:hypothetical protein